MNKGPRNTASKQEVDRVMRLIERHRKQQGYTQPFEEFMAEDMERTIVKLKAKRKQLGYS